MSLSIKREIADVDVPSSSKRKPAPSTASKVSPGRQQRAKLTPKQPTITPQVLFDAAQTGNLEKVKECIENGIGQDANKDGFTALHFACEHAWSEIVEYLVGERKANAEAKSFKKKFSPLHLACVAGNSEIVDFLVETCRVDANEADIDGCTALHCATQHGHMLIVKYLIQDGVNKEKIDINGSTALHVASEYGHLNVLNY